MRTNLFDNFGPSRAGKSMKNQNGHETVKETSPRPFTKKRHDSHGTTGFANYSTQTFEIFFSILKV